MDLKGIVYDGMDWIQVVQNMNLWRSL